VYTLSLKESHQNSKLLELFPSSAEFEHIPIRRHEDALLRRVYDRVPVKLDRVDFERLIQDFPSSPSSFFSVTPTS